MHVLSPSILPFFYRWFRTKPKYRILLLTILFCPTTELRRAACDIAWIDFLGLFDDPLKQKWDKSLSPLHIYLICITEMLQTLGFVILCRKKQKEGRGKRQKQPEPWRVLEEGSPRKKQEGRIEWMAYIFVDSHSDQGRRFLKCDQLGIRSVLIGVANNSKQVHSMNHQEDGNKEKEPWNELLRRERIFEPLESIEQDESQDRLPRKKTVEAVWVRVEQRFSRNIDDKSRNYGKNNHSDHFMFLSAQRSHITCAGNHHCP